jgi:5'-3' exoribonuclease 1
MCVLPPKSANLLPEPLAELLLDKDSELSESCPTEFDIDLSGKRKEWEGIVLLPMVNFDTVRKLYFDNLSKIITADKKRNIFGKTFKYHIDKSSPYLFKSYYGNINNCVSKILLFDL